MKRGSTGGLDLREHRRRTGDDGLDVDLSRLRFVGRGVYRDRRVGLAALRAAAGLTQVEMAERMKVTQTQVSKIEVGEDHRTSTLRRYAEALGGGLEVAVVLGGRRYRIG